MGGYGVIILVVFECFEDERDDGTGCSNCFRLCFFPGVFGYARAGGKRRAPIAFRLERNVMFSREDIEPLDCLSSSGLFTNDILELIFVQGV